MIAIVATKKIYKGKVYFARYDLKQRIPNFNDIEYKIESIKYLIDNETEELPMEKIQDQETINIRTSLYGLTQFEELFTPRQLLALLTFVTEVQMAYSVILEDGS